VKCREWRRVGSLAVGGPQDWEGGRRSARDEELLCVQRLEQAPDGRAAVRDAGPGEVKGAGTEAVEEEVRPLPPQGVHQAMAPHTKLEALP